MSIFAGKTLMITGGTGSFGNAVLKRFLRTDIAEIRIFSRDEKKQDDMRHEYQAKFPDVAHKIKFYIGDVRSLESVRSAMPGTDYIFHAAALKQVPSCEFFPMEAVRTNVIGTDNVLTAAIENNVGAVICLSTDKAAYPMVTIRGISIPIMRIQKRVLKSRSLLNRAICILEKASRGMHIQDTAITIPLPSQPTNLAIGAEKMQIPNQISRETIKLDQKATAVDLYFSSSFLNSC